MSLTESYTKAVNTFHQLQETHLSAKSYEYRLLHSRCLNELAETAQKIDKLNLFPRDCCVDDVPTNELRFMNVQYMIGIVVEKTPIDVAHTTHLARLSLLKIAFRQLLLFADLLHSYKIVEESIYANILETCFPQGPQGKFILNVKDLFSDSKTRDMVSRQLAIHQKRLDRLMETSQSQTKSDDINNLRNIELGRLSVCWFKTWYSLSDMVSEIRLLISMSDENRLFLESTMLYLPSPYLDANSINDIVNEVGGPTFLGFKESLDTRISQQPENIDHSMKVEQSVISKQGRVTQPFVITNKSVRDVLNGVKGTGQRLPTISIEELVNKEMENSLKSDMFKDLVDINPKDPDDVELMRILREEGRNKMEVGGPETNKEFDEQTMKDRKWDEYTETHRRGEGNTMNLG